MSSPASIEFVLAGFKIQVTITSAGVPEVQAPALTKQTADVPELPELTPTEERLYRRLTDQRQTALAVARQAGYTGATASFYGTMRRLIEKGLAERMFGGGFRRIGATLPQAGEPEQPVRPRHRVASRNSPAPCASAQESPPLAPNRPGIMDWQPHAAVNGNGHAK